MAFYAAGRLVEKPKMSNSFPHDRENRPHGRENQTGARALMSATDEGDAARVASLVVAGARADARLSNGETPLMRASARGFADVARALLDAGADVNAQRGDGFTPLVLAVFFGHEEVVRLLLERGADAGAATRLGTTAESWAAARGFAEISRLLRSAEAARPRDSAKTVKTKSERTVKRQVERARVEDISIFSRGRAGVATSVFASPDEGAAARTSNASDANDSNAYASAANVSVRRDESVPAHPSASSFRLGGFLRSWQASVGTALLVLAIGVAVFALWRDGKTAGRSAQPAPTPQATAPQTVAQPVTPAQSVAAPQLSTTLPTPDAQGVAAPAEMPGATYAVPAPAGQPFYVPLAGQANAPREPTVLSENGVPATDDAARSKNKTDARTRDAASAPTGENRNEPNAEDNSRAATSGRNSHTTDTEPARSSSQPAAPAPSPTPEHGKVIPWPPQ